MNEASMKLLELFKDDWSHDLQTAKKLISNGADVNSADEAGNTPLLLELSTCFGTSEEALEFLCKNGADIHHKNHRGQNALMLSVRKSPGLIFDGKYPTPLNEFSSWLIKESVDVGATDIEGNSVVHYAYGNKKILELLIKSGLLINQLNNKQQTLLHVPAGVYLSLDHQSKPQYGGITTATLKWLLQQGIDPNARDTDGHTSLHAVSRINSYEPQKAAQTLIDGGADLRVVDANGTSLADYHLREGSQKLAKWISTQVSKKQIANESDSQSPAKTHAISGAAPISVPAKESSSAAKQRVSGAKHSIPKVTKEIETQRQRVSEAMAILEPILSDVNVRESTKNRIRFALDIAQPTYQYSLKETSPREMNRLSSMVGGWPYTSQKYPWPMNRDRPFPPFIQLNLKDISSLSNTDLGDGLLQVWATHESSLVRAIDQVDMLDPPSGEYLDTGILEIGEDDSRFDSIAFEQMPHARKNSIICVGKPKPTVIPYFDACTSYGLDDEDLSDDQHKLIDQSIKLVKKYFSSYTSSNLLGAQQFRQCGYGFYIDMCVNEGWRPLMCFCSDGSELEFGYDGQGYLLYRIVDSKREFFFYWDR